MVSSNRTVGETQPRSDSEIEVDFAHTRINSDTKELKSANSNQLNSKRSFSIHPKTFTDDGSQDDTEGSSIIDLRGDDKKVKKKRNRSPGVGAEVVGSNKEEYKGEEIHVECQEENMSFHTALAEFQKDDWKFNAPKLSKSEKEKGVIEKKGDSEEEREEKGSEKERPESENSRDSEKSSKEEKRRSSNEFIMKKTFKEKENYSKRSYDEETTPPRSPSFSFRSTIDLLPSTNIRNGLRQQVSSKFVC